MNEDFEGALEDVEKEEGEEGEEDEGTLLIPLAWNRIFRAVKHHT